MEENPDMDVDLKAKLDTYYDTIRQLCYIYGKQTSVYGLGCDDVITGTKYVS
jgi:hypothetical protein